MIGRRVRAAFASYRATLKPLELEEPLDLVVYRPLAFVFVHAVRHLPITPNQISIASLMAGIAAGACFWQGGALGYLLGAAFYFLCNVLDCADGQLARLRAAKSFAGYILDGTVDTLTAVAVFVGIMHGPPADYEGTPWWIGLVAAAGLAMVCSSVLADRTRQQWMARVYGSSADSDAEAASLAAEAASSSARWKLAGLGVLLAFYRGYRRLCDAPRPATPETVNEAGDAAWRRAHLPILRSAVLGGPTAHISGIILAASFNRIELYLVSAVALGLSSAVAIRTAERMARRRLARQMINAA